MRISDWSSDVCSSDLLLIEREERHRIDNFDLDPLFGQCRRCAHCMTPHQTDRDHRDIATLALHRSLPERIDMIAIGPFSLLAAAAGGPREQDRITIAAAGQIGRAWGRESEVQYVWTGGG